MAPTRWLLAISLLVLPSLAFDPVDIAFIPDSEPLSLDASVISHSATVFHVSDAVRSGTTRGVFSNQVSVSLRVDCPSSKSPENDACRAAGIYPANIYHTKPDIWGGTTTYPADNSTTTWRCTVGSDAESRGAELMADCSKTIESAGNVRIESTIYDNCYAVAHMLPIVMTAGADKIDPPPLTELTYDSGAVVTLTAGAFISGYSKLLSLGGCPASETTMWAASVTANPGQTQTAPGSESPTNGSSEENAGTRRLGGNVLCVGIAVAALVAGFLTE